MQIVKGIKFLKAYASGKSHINADLDLIMTMAMILHEIYQHQN